MCFRELLQSILDLIKSIFDKDKEYENIKDIPASKNQEAIELLKKVLKDQGIAKLQIKYNHKNVYSYVNWDNAEGLNIKTKKISIEKLAQSVKSYLEATQRKLNKNITETNQKIEKLDELIAILEEYNKK